MSFLRRKIAATLALASLMSASVTIGLAPSANAIINGTAITSSALDGAQFGWLVRLEGAGCTGSLIDPEWVLTAAHCVEIDVGAGITAFFGAIGSEEGTAISEIVLHPSFDGGSDADLALLKLSSPATRPLVQLGGTTDSLATDTAVQIAGWGVTSIDGDVPSAPRMGESVVTDLTSQVVVTGGPSFGCSGDSGGPVLASGVLVAVISASDAQCAESTFSTRISAHRAWIASIVGAGNLPPIATGGSITASPGSPVEITFAFSDPDSDSAQITDLQLDDTVWNLDSFECVEEPGAVVCIFTPLFEFVGATEVSYQVSDSAGATDSATWVVTFVAAPTAPVAADATVAVVINRDANVELTATDANGDSLAFEIVGQPQHGILSDCTTGTCVYTPDIDYEGADSFTFTAMDGGGLVSNIATVTVEVAPNAAPEVFDFAVIVGRNTPTGISLVGSDPNGDQLVYSIIDGPTSGSLDDCSAGGCTYTPSLDFEGFDGFTYVAADTEGLDSEIATVTIDVVGNFAPQVWDVTAATKAGLPVGFTLEAVDTEGDPLTFEVVSPPAHGQLVGCETGECRYTSTIDFNGFDSFTWTASDEFGTSILAMATIEVAGRNWDVTPIESPAAGRQLMAAIIDGDLTATGSFSGATAAAGTFSGAADVIGIDTGIVLSTGRVVDVVGPNFDENRSTVHGGPGADDLFTGIESVDAVSLRYEIVPASNQLHFRYVLASEEYSDGGYIFPDFDDTAIVSVDGRVCGLPGAPEGLPLSVSSIRLGTYDDDFQPIDDPINGDLFVDNNFGSSAFDIEMDGFSSVIECTLDVVPGQAVVVTVAIADGGDGGVDSALFIEGNIVTDSGDLLDELRGMTAGLTIATSLTAKIDAAKAAIDSARIASACGVLKALTKEVTAQSGRKIPTATASDLIATVGRISATLGCS